MDKKLIDSYLFNEMSHAEREQFEDKFVADEFMFIEIAERENELVDRYVRNELSGTVSKRFEQSLATLPSRRQKVTNAKTLQQYVADERSQTKTITIAERSTLFSKLAEMFAFKSPALQFASIGMIAILTIGIAFLVFENRRLGSLQQELAEAQRRESELSTQLESERDTAGDLIADLDAERERIQKLEGEIDKLSAQGANVRPPANAAAPTIATLILAPAGVRGGPALVRRVELPADATRLSIVLTLPTETGDRVSLKLNGETLSENRRVSVRKNGEKVVSVTIPASRIKDERNDVDVLDRTGTVIAKYPFAVSRTRY